MNRAIDAASAALQKIVAGDLARGLAQYRLALKAHHGNVPVGLHAKMLTAAGHKSGADALISMALDAGADLALAPFVDPRNSRRAAFEYEALFERGLINAWMVSRYLLALDTLRRYQTLGKLLDPDRILHAVHIDVDRGPSSPSLVGAVTKAVLSHEHAAHYQEAVQSVRRMRMLPSVHRIADPAFEALCAVIRTEVAQYMATCHSGDHPVSRWVPETFEVEVWALISDGRGSNERHVHHRGWSTGVFYATGLEDGHNDGGCLHLGRPAEVAPDAPGWPDIRIRPEPGLLVILPSYVTHWVSPIGRPSLRIAVPFDVIDDRGHCSVPRLPLSSSRSVPPPGDHP